MSYQSWPLAIMISMVISVVLSGCDTGQKAVEVDVAPVEEGEPFPPFIGLTLQGNTVDNTYFNDHVTLVSAWRLGCKWSMLEIPEYNRLIRSINDPRFQAISMVPQTREEMEAFYDDEERKGMMGALEGIETEAPVYDVLPMCSMRRHIDPEELGAQCDAVKDLIDAESFPVTFIVGPDGIIRHRHDGLIVDPQTMQPDISAFKHDLDSLLKVL